MSEAKKKGTWELVLKIIIAVASAIAGALGTAACQGRLWFFVFCLLITKMVLTLQVINTYKKEKYVFINI